MVFLDIPSRSAKFALSETEEEPLFSKLPAGQARLRLPQGASGVQGSDRRRHREADTTNVRHSRAQ
jgi:hypothetical protein